MINKGGSLARAAFFMGLANLAVACSGHEPGMQRRRIKRGKPVMPQPAQVAVKKGAQIGDPVFQHGDPVDPHPKGKALPLIRVNPSGAQHMRMHHAGAQNLQPAVAFADLQRAVLPRTLNVDLGRRFGEGEMRGAEAGLDAVDFEEGQKNSSSTHFRFAIDRSLSIARPST